MCKSQNFGVLGVALAVGFIGIWQPSAGGPAVAEQRVKFTKAYNDGNYKIAYEGLRKLALDPKNDPMLVGKDLECDHQKGR